MIKISKINMTIIIDLLDYFIEDFSDFENCE